MQALIISKTFDMCDGFSDFNIKENVSSFSLSTPGGVTGNFPRPFEERQNELEAYRF